MSAYFAIEPAWLSNPKVLAVPVYACQLWLAGGLYAVAGETDGRIPKRQLPVIALQARVSPKHAEALVDAGLWHDRGDHYEIHDFLKYNQSRALREAQREKWRKAKAKAAGVSEVESHEESPRIPRRVPRASLPCLALPTSKEVTGSTVESARNDSDPPEPVGVTETGLAELARIKAGLAQRCKPVTSDNGQGAA